MKKLFSGWFNVKLMVLVSGILLLTGCSEPQRLSLLPSHAKILAFGDSLTHGVGADKGHAYPDVLAELTNLTVINEGIPGEVSEKGLVRLPKLLRQHKPDLLILCHGGNDLIRRKNTVLLKQNLIAMIEQARQRNIEVVLIGVPKAKLFGGTHSVYKEVAEEMDVPFESEALNELLRDNSLKSDYVHLNNAGYEIFAERIFQLLQREGAL